MPRKPAKEKGAVRRSRAAAPSAPDVLVVGGGVMGCACAWVLAREGARVTVLERSVPGAEASSAAAGIIGARTEAEHPGPLANLMARGQARHAPWSRSLFEATGLDVEYRRTGILRIAFDDGEYKRLCEATRWQRDGRGGARPLTRSQTLRLEPELGSVTGSVHFPGDGRIDPKLLLRALHIAAQRAGVQFRTGAYVRRITSRGGRAGTVVLEEGTRLDARWIVIAAGSWSSLVEGLPPRMRQVRPARGQIVELETPAPLLRRPVLGPRCYVVPRDDGRALVGSTLEFVGYQRAVTASAVRDLLIAAIELVPGLGVASLRATWSSFRPYTDDELPILGETATEGLLLASGHYRTGILLAPITAEIIAALVSGRRPPVDLRPFRP